MAGPTIVGTQVKWGTSSNTTYGMIQTITHSKGGSIKEYKDYQGDTKTLVISDKHDAVTITAICLASATLPEYGAEVTITLADSSGLTVRVQSAQVDWNNEDAARITITGRTYPSLDAATGTTTVSK